MAKLAREFNIWADGSYRQRRAGAGIVLSDVFNREILLAASIPFTHLYPQDSEQAEFIAAGLALDLGSRFGIAKDFYGDNGNVLRMIGERIRPKSAKISDQMRQICDLVASFQEKYPSVKAVHASDYDETKPLMKLTHELSVRASAITDAGESQRIFSAIFAASSGTSICTRDGAHGSRVLARGQPMLTGSWACSGSHPS